MRSVSMDSRPQLVVVGADLAVPSRAWSLNVLNSSTMGMSSHEIKTAGNTCCESTRLIRELCLDKIVLDLGV
jgi:hypothetical protein